MQIHVGIDDTDSRKGGCTTYVAACLVEKLVKADVRFVDYPNIIRLNPNVPYKTRGNAAVALRFDIPSNKYGGVQETVIQEVERRSHIGEPDTDPAIVFLTGRPTSPIIRLSRKALCDIVPEQEALKALRMSGAAAAAYGNKLGLVGAVAAVGETLDGDHTYELVAYRRPEYLGTPRRVDENSIRRMHESTVPKTFNSYDLENKRALITPHGPDPVLLGLRGEDAGTVRRAFHMLAIREPIERWVIFRTNHGTDAHLKKTSSAGPLRSHRPAVLRGIVGSSPERITGGHVFFRLNYKSSDVKCAAFEPTGKFKEIVASLIPGDEVTVFGGVAEHILGLTVNLEKMRIHRLARKAHLENPACPRCKKHLKSAGKKQGFRCERCSFEAPAASKRTVAENRRVRVGLYVPASKANRHLTKPLCRYGKEKTAWDQRPPSGKWHDP